MGKPTIQQRIDDVEAALTPSIEDSLKQVRELFASLSDEHTEQLARALGIVLNSYRDPEWKCLVITLNEEKGALILAGSPKVSEADAASIVELAQDAIINAATQGAPEDKKEWN